jgi:hypothetical protein
MPSGETSSFVLNGPARCIVQGYTETDHVQAESYPDPPYAVSMTSADPIACGDQNVGHTPPEKPLLPKSTCRKRRKMKRNPGGRFRTVKSKKN